MHLGNGAIMPACAIYGASVALAGLGVGVASAKKIGAPDPHKFAAMTAIVFAAQTFNVHIMPAASGHMLGGFALAMMFGGGWGLIGMSLLLAMQCLVFGDGGWMSLGCNVLNMGVIPCLIAYPIWKKLAGRTTGNVRWLGIAAAACISVVMASAACALEILSQPTARNAALSIIGTMIGIHVIVGLLEAGMTLLLLKIADSLARPLVGVLAGAFLLIAASIGASPWPDGLEFTLALFSLSGGSAEGLFADYTLTTSFTGAAILAICAATLTRCIPKRGNHG